MPEQGPTAEPRFFGRRHAHEACVQRALAEAEAVCGQRGARLTPIRRAVLALVWESHRAIKAYDILDALAARGRRAKPATVYRALEFLLEHGLVHRIDSLNAFVGCLAPTRDHRAQFLICEDCGEVSEMAAPAINRAVARKAGAAGFAVRHQIIELHGRCPECRPS